MKYKITTIIIIIFSLFFSFGLNQANAEYRQVDPSNFATEKTAVLFLSGPVELADGTYKMKLMIDTGGQSANALLASLTYPKDINIEELNIDNSICDLFIENDFDNEQGVLNIACGKPYPGFNGSYEVAEITFKKIQTVNMSFEFSPDSMILANDGYGTDILFEAKNLNFTI